MNRILSLLLLTAAILPATGCKDLHAPGAPEVEHNPEQLMDGKKLFAQNCAACHGTEGKGGASISLANSVYIAIAGEQTIATTAANGVPGTLMPAFARGKGGMLTDAQVAAIAHTIVSSWGNPQALGGQTPPPYKASLTGNVANGHAAYVTSCARCHGADGTGNHQAKNPVGSIVDPTYLSLVGDQYLRSRILAGMPEQGMPDWRSDVPGHPLTDQEVTDIVAWLTAHRTSSPGQQYTQSENQ
jgi:cytochrome c oxidase cbb3-type subunit 3/ubiquinol-cytochrome c reductase cytochrome c subunit